MCLCLQHLICVANRQGLALSTQGIPCHSARSRSSSALLQSWEQKAIFQSKLQPLDYMLLWKKFHWNIVIHAVSRMRSSPTPSASSPLREKHRNTRGQLRSFSFITVSIITLKTTSSLAFLIELYPSIVSKHCILLYAYIIYPLPSICYQTDYIFCYDGICMYYQSLALFLCFPYPCLLLFSLPSLLKRKNYQEASLVFHVENI